MLPEIARSSPSRRNPFYRSANFNDLLGVHPVLVADERARPKHWP
jgi:hypothetical protein